jgi:hypothetical protein
MQWQLASWSVHFKWCGLWWLDGLTPFTGHQVVTIGTTLSSQGTWWIQTLHAAMSFITWTPTNKTDWLYLWNMGNELHIHTADHPCRLQYILQQILVCVHHIIMFKLSPRVIHSSSELDLWSWAYILEGKVTLFMAWTTRIKITTQYYGWHLFHHLVMNFVVTLYWCLHN